MAFNIMKLHQEKQEQRLPKPTQNHIEHLTCCVCFQDSEIVEQLLSSYQFSKEQLDHIVNTFPSLFTLQDIHHRSSIKIIKLFIIHSVSKIYVCPQITAAAQSTLNLLKLCQINKVQIWICHNTIEQTREFLNLCLESGISVNIGMNFFSYDYMRRFGMLQYWTRKYFYNLLKTINQENNTETRLMVDRVMLYVPF